MLDHILEKIKPDEDLPARTRIIDIRNRALNGTLYDVLPHPFYREESPAKEYIPLTERRPSVRSGLVKTVVDDSVSLLFSEGHFPALQLDDEGAKEALEAVIKNARIKEAMIDAATRGSVGSVAIWVRFLDKRVFVSALETTYLTPDWMPDAPDTLKGVRELRKVTGRQLRDAGYPLEKGDDGKLYWFRRTWDSTEETWYQPVEVGSENEDAPPRDSERSVIHALGFVPIIWVKNLPGGDEIDGAPTFTMDALATVVEMDYQMSQAGRGLRYSADPTLLIKEPAFSDGKLVRSASNAITVSAEGDAKLLEITGDASQAVVEYCKALREMAMEAMHGNRSNADKLSAAQSGRALELMHQALIWLADKLRSSYGEGALLALLKMIARGAQKYPLTIDGKGLNLGSNLELALRWPAWFPPTAEDRNTTANALKTHIDSGTLSQETAVSTVAADFDIEDVPAELARIATDRQARIDEMVKSAGAATAAI